MLEGCCQSASKIQRELAFFPADRRSGGFSGADSSRRLVAGLIGPVEIELVEVVASAIKLVKVTGRAQSRGNMKYCNSNEVLGSC